MHRKLSTGVEIPEDVAARCFDFLVDNVQIGFPGMKARVDSYAEDTPFYRAEKRAAAAMMRFLDRLIAEGKRELEENAAGGFFLPKAIAGWNIRWNDIPRKEQDDFIARIETVGA